MNLQSLILSNFRRVNDKSAPDLLQPDEAVQLQDVVLDHKLGKPVKRGDFQYYDTPVTAGADILKLTDVKDDSNQQNILAAVGTALRSYDPSTNSWSDYIPLCSEGIQIAGVIIYLHYIMALNSGKFLSQISLFLHLIPMMNL